jgi:hypothetical protein
VSELNSDQIQLLAAATLQVLSRHQSSYVGKFTDLALAVRQSRSGNFSHKDIEESLVIFERLDGMTRSQLASSGDFIRIDINTIESRFMRINTLDSGPRKVFPLLFEYTQYGGDWLDRIWSDYFPETDNKLSVVRQATVENSAEFAPASDRIVRITDNQIEAANAKLALSDLDSHLREANDIGGFSPEEIEEAKREVWLLEQELNQAFVRVDWIEPLAKACLQWIAVKAAEQIAGALAIAALTALAILFGFSV